MHVTYKNVVPQEIPIGTDCKSALADLNIRDYKAKKAYASQSLPQRF